MFFFECKKKPFDVRKKYIGTWNFTYTTSTYSAGQTTSSSNIEYLGSVYLDSADKSQTWIYINLGLHYTIRCKIYKSYFSNKAGLDGGDQSFRGSFNSKNSLSLDYSSTGLGSGYTMDNIKGIKK